MLGVRMTMVTGILCVLYGCGRSPQGEFPHSRTFSPTDESNEIDPEPQRRYIGTNVIHLADQSEYQEKNWQGKQHWQDAVDYAEWLNAKFVRITASYKPDQLGLATSIGSRICNYYRYNPKVKYLIALSEKSLGDSNHGPYPQKYDMIRAWSEGTTDDFKLAKRSRHWLYSYNVITHVVNNCPEAVFAWEVGNEINCHECSRIGDDSSSPALSDAERATRMQDYENFIINYTTELKKLTPNHKFSLGIIRAGWLSYYVRGGHAQDGFSNPNFWDSQSMFDKNRFVGVDWIRVYSSASIDYVTVHPYGHPWFKDNMGVEHPHTFLPDIRIAEIVGKPLIIEEFGPTPSWTGGFGRDPKMELRVESYKIWLDWFAQNARNVNELYAAPWQAAFIKPESAGLAWFGGSCFRDPKAIQGYRCQIEKDLERFRTH